MAKNPDAWLAHNNLGTVLRQAGKPEEAIDHFARAVQLKPDYAEAHFNLGLMLASQGQATTALEHYRKALDLANQKGNTTLANAIRSKIN